MRGHSVAPCGVQPLEEVVGRLLDLGVVVLCGALLGGDETRPVDLPEVTVGKLTLYTGRNGKQSRVDTVPDPSSNFVGFYYSSSS